MLTAATVILILKIAVIAVTLLLIGALLALWRRNYRLHGRINLVVFILTLAALLGLEVVARLVDPDIFKDHFDRHGASSALTVHLAFSVPAALVLPLMLFSGLKRHRTFHIALGLVFVTLWTGTLITGVFFLPHTPAP